MSKNMEVEVYTPVRVVAMRLRRAFGTVQSSRFNIKTHSVCLDVIETSERSESYTGTEPDPTWNFER